MTRKANQRKRLKQVDTVIETVRASGVECAALVRRLPFTQRDLASRVCLGFQDKALELPKEHEMPAKDKYTTFSAWDRGYRKGIHKVPKFTRVSVQLLFVLADSHVTSQLTLRTNPKGF